MEQSEWLVRKELVAVKRALLATQRILGRTQEQLFAYMERDVQADDAKLGDKWAAPVYTDGQAQTATVLPIKPDKQ